jgi:PPOX class probable F420-dependent enzyme
VATVDDIRRLVALDHGLASLSTLRIDDGIQVTLVNAGVIDHPTGGDPVAAFVSRQSTVKLANLQRRPQATLLWRAGWAWAAAEGTAEIIGPDGPEVPGLLRTIYSAAGGGEHEDWAEFDRVMAAEHRCAVLLRPARIYVNP